MIIGIVLLIILIIVIAVIASKTKDVAEAAYDAFEGDGDDDSHPQAIPKIPASTNSDPDPASITKGGD